MTKRKVVNIQCMKYQIHNINDLVSKEIILVNIFYDMDHFIHDHIDPVS